MAGDIVEVTCGIYYEHAIVMKSGVSLRSATGDPECVIIDAQQQGRVLSGEGQSDATRIEGVTFTGDFVQGALPHGTGAGVLWQNSAGSFHACVFVANETGAPGSGAAMEFYLSAAVLGEDCIFMDNIAYHHAGAVELNDSDDISFQHCVFSRNTTGVAGAALASTNSSTTVNAYTFVGNNTPDYVGEVIASVDSSVMLSHCLIAFNDTDSIVNFQGPYSFFCCDIYGNSGGDWYGNFGNWVQANGNFSADPCFCDLEGGDYRLCADSWCLPGNHPWGCDDLVGALGTGCEACECGGFVATAAPGPGGC